MSKDYTRYSRLSYLRSLYDRHEKEYKVKSEECPNKKYCQLCEEIAVIEEQLGIEMGAHVSLTKEVRENIKKMLEEGYLDREIVQELKVSYNTVKQYRILLDNRKKKKSQLGKGGK